VKTVSFIPIPPTVFLKKQGWDVSKLTSHPRSLNLENELKKFVQLVNVSFNFSHFIILKNPGQQRGDLAFIGSRIF
jgi:hypothetical protein